MNTSKIIKAYIRDGTYSTTEPITQGDYGYILQIEGTVLPPVYRVDFSNDRHKGEALLVYGNENGVEVPEELIATGKDIFAFYFYIKENFGKTAYTWKIPNGTRAQNGDREPTPTQQDSIDQLVVRSNEAVERAEQAKADAETAQGKAEDAQDAAEEAERNARQSASAASQKATESAQSASQASASATASAQSASQSAQIKDDVESMVDDAQASASASAQSATSSANSASQASASATSASQSATSAQGYANQAQTSAQTASTRASEASGYASTASTKATESAQSASQASGYAQTAEQAKTASQTAQGLAEQAQARAEVAAASVSASATQIELNADAGTKKINDESFWTQGYWAVKNGTITRGNTWNRSLKAIDDTIESIVSTDDIKLLLMAYDGSTYVGTWFGNGYSTTYNASYVSHEINFAEFRKNYPTYTFRVTVTKTTSGELLPSETAQKVTIIKSIAKADRNGIQILYGDLVNEKYWQNGGITAQGVDPTAYDSEYFKRVCTINKMRFLLPVTVTPKSGYMFSVNQYALNGTFEKQFSAWSSLPYTLSDTNKLYRIAIKASNSSVLETSDIGTYISAKLAESTPSNRGLAEYANVKAVNHRGYNVEAPENTLPAYLLSARYGYKYVETDVLFTSDGVPVLMHDDTIDRTCCHASDGSAVTGDISIESVSYADLIASYDACTPAQWATWAGVKVPTFEEFMRYCRALNLHPWIELKWTHTYTQAEIDLIISIVKKYGMEEHVSFISFSYDALALVKDAWDTVELGLNGSVSDAQLLKTGKNRVFMIYNYTSSYSAAINAGFQICFYTVNTENALNGINTYAYDSILTNTLLPSQVCDIVRNKSVT